MPAVAQRPTLPDELARRVAALQQDAIIAGIQNR